MKEYTGNDGRLYREVQLKDGTSAKIKVPTLRELHIIKKKYRNKPGRNSSYMVQDFVLFNDKKRTIEQIDNMGIGDTIRINQALLQ
ncbi:MAG TPA: hypothetical protein PKE30_08240 [Niabella sp.]|nr:hypothetical protein [Niabella sp.]